jgi:hypothetical protein
MQLAVIATDVQAPSIGAIIVYPGGRRTPPVDVDGSFTVDEKDLLAFWGSYGIREGGPGYCAIADWDGNGVVDLEDLARYFDAYEQYKGTNVGATYGNGLVFPASGMPNSHGFHVPQPIVSARTDPAGFEPWIQWRVNGSIIRSTGPVFTENFQSPGEQQVSAAIFGSVAATAENRRLTIYKVKAPTLESALIEDGVEYTFVAETEPPGFEGYINWYASTKYGTVTNSRARGATFTVRFDGTWGPDMQWLGIQADNVYLNQDQKPCQ